MIAKIHDIKELLARGGVETNAVFPELRRLAASDQWQTREVAATALVTLLPHYLSLMFIDFKQVLK